MNFLCQIYADRFSMLVGKSGKHELLELAMLVTVSMTILCALGVAFYLQFLIALSKECRHHRIRYLVRLQSDSLEHAIPDDRVLDSRRERCRRVEGDVGGTDGGKFLRVKWQICLQALHQVEHDHRDQTEQQHADRVLNSILSLNPTSAGAGRNLSSIRFKHSDCSTF